MTNPNAVRETHIPQFLQVIKEQVEAYSPSSSLVKVNGHNMGRLELKTPDSADDDGYIYNQMQLSSFKGKLLISSFNVTSDLEDKYKDLGESMLSSLKY